MYDVIIEKAPRSEWGFHPINGTRGAFTISIRDMLTGVKDYNGNPYFQESGLHHKAADSTKARLERTSQGNNKTKGAYYSRDGKHFIDLAKTADRSTFIHETSHMFLSMLRDIAAKYPDSQIAKDVKTIDKWAAWDNTQIREYKNTATEAEFAAMDRDIKKAGQAKDMAEVARLKSIWAQERWARGVEQYLMEGKAPHAGLQSVFARFSVPRASGGDPYAPKKQRYI